MTNFAMPWIGVLRVVTGLAIWKPVQFSPLTNMLGGYAWARYWHFVAMVAIVALAVGHIFMVFAVDPYSLRSMITGGYSERLSPEERNARPFLNLWPKRAPAPEVEAVAEPVGEAIGERVAEESKTT